MESYFLWALGPGMQSQAVEGSMTPDPSLVISRPWRQNRKDKLPEPWGGAQGHPPGHGGRCLHPYPSELQKGQGNPGRICIDFLHLLWPGVEEWDGEASGAFQFLPRAVLAVEPELSVLLALLSGCGEGFLPS